MQQSKAAFISFRFSILKPIIVTFVSLEMFWSKHTRVEIGRTEGSSAGLNSD